MSSLHATMMTLSTEDCFYLPVPAGFIQVLLTSGVQAVFKIFACFVYNVVFKLILPVYYNVFL